ncbi:MAG: acylphosphatase [bacterium]|nr:acylphosphatase [bacterium]
MLSRAHIWVSGLVQGVYYRWFAQTKAKALGLNGWVRNLWDGRVEVVCEGEKGLIMDFIKELRVGPRAAEVKGVEVKWEEYTGEFSEFSIKF